LEVWDEIRLFKSSAKFGKGITGPEFTGDLVARDQFEEDELSVYYKK
jgi:hypothetical protein